jgi:putative phosphoribosyl transferase
MFFNDRRHAAQQLARRLAGYRGKHPLVLGIPRGGVIMASVIADELDGEVDVALVHKLGAPGQPEFAIGAVDEEGNVYLSGDADVLGVPQSYIDREKRQQLALLQARRKLYTPVRPPISPRDRVVIVVDDGLATGATMIAALRALKANHPKKLIAAAAVSPPDTILRVAELADEMVCLEAPRSFFAVGQFFRDFQQVDDSEVIAILRHSVDPSADSSEV